MAERRSQAPDRRTVYRGGRRATDYDHGTRALYQRGCRCLLCRAAEAAYRGELRKLKAREQQPLGSLVSASRLWQRVKALQIEGFTQAEIARRIGLCSPELQFAADRVTLRNFLKIQWLYRRVFVEPSDAPHS